jgi:hypothetical protein
VLKRAVGVKLSFLDGTFLVETGKVGRVISALPLRALVSFPTPKCSMLGNIKLLRFTPPWESS